MKMNMKMDENNEQERLPTWSDIFYDAMIWLDSSTRTKKQCLEMMRAIEDAGHGDSVERYLLDLALNYGFNRADLKARVLDMLYGDYFKIYSYQGWESLTTRTVNSIRTDTTKPCTCCGGEEE